MALTLEACSQNVSSKTAGPQLAAKLPVADNNYFFAIHPLLNPAHLFKVYKPLVEYLNRNIPGTTFR